VFIEEQAYNRNLKEIASMSGISKRMFNKVARHTNAQLWVRYGAERPIISKMLGHQKEETTRNYKNERTGIISCVCFYNGYCMRKLEKWNNSIIAIFIPFT
jgi:site-specific recombinase XerD